MSILFITVLGMASLLFAWMMVRLRLAVKAKSYEAKKRQAMINLQLGGGHPPSWFEGLKRRDQFFAGVDRLARRRGLPPSYARTVLAKEVNFRRLSWYVGALEDQGAHWVEQQMAVADQIAEWWATEERLLNQAII